MISNRTRRWPEWWFYILLFFVGLQTLFFVVPHLRLGGEISTLCWSLGQDPIVWIIVVSVIALTAIIRAAIRRPIFNRWRVIAVVMLIALLLSPHLFRVYPSSHEGEIPPIEFRVPVDGPLFVGWGGNTPDVNYHVAYSDQRWAYDLLIVKDGMSYRGEGKVCEDFYCYNVPIVAPAVGTVVFVQNEDPDMPIGDLGGGTDAGGNQIVLEVAPKHFLYMCHMRKGSVTVKVGEKVKIGQVIGRIGNSGNTSEPHLHIHLQDTAEMGGEGIPLYFYNYMCEGKLVPREMPTGGFNDNGWAGQSIEHVPPIKVR